MKKYYSPATGKIETLVDETDTCGNRDLYGSCGCHASSGGGACGSRGDAWIYYPCRGDAAEEYLCWQDPAGNGKDPA